MFSDSIGIIILNDYVYIKRKYYHTYIKANTNYFPLLISLIINRNTSVNFTICLSLSFMLQLHNTWNIVSHLPHDSYLLKSDVFITGPLISHGIVIWISSFASETEKETKNVCIIGWGCWKVEKTLFQKKITCWNSVELVITTLS